MHWIWGAPLVFAAALVVALVAIRSRWAAVGVAVGGLFVPFAIDPAVPLVRALTVHATLVIVMRAIDLATDPRPRSLPWVMASLLFIGDLRTAEPTRPRLDRRAALGTLGYATLGIFAALLAFGSSDTVARWLGGLALIYAVADGASAAFHLLATALGYRFAPMHDVPIAARTLREFWGRRWNRTVSRWLHRHVFVPLSRRSAGEPALLAGFGLSAALHVWLVFVPVGLVPALLMGAFFVVQGIAAWIETPLGVRRWPVLLRHAWTLGVLVATSPLFIAPFLRVIAI